MRWSQLLGMGILWGREKVGRGRSRRSPAQNREFDLFVAQSELEREGDLRRGAARLAHLLAREPGRPDLLDLLERYCQAQPDAPEELFPTAEEVSGSESDGPEAVHAWLLHRQGRLAEAVQRLVALVRARPDAAYLEAWVLPWLEAPRAHDALTPEIRLDLVRLAVERFPDDRDLTAGRCRQLERYLPLVASGTWPPEWEEAAQTARVGLLRKTGRWRHALDAAQNLVQQHPGAKAQWERARVHRDRGDMDQARADFAAAQSQLEEPGPELEAAQLEIEQQCWDRARARYERVLQQQPEHPVALPSLRFCQWKLTGEPHFLDDLGKLLQHDQHGARASELYRRLIPFIGYLPEMRDETANALRQIRSDLASLKGDGNDHVYQLTLDYLGPPSNLLAFRLMTDSLPRRPRLATSVQHIPEPDPRRPCRPVKYLLWAFHEAEAWPSIPLADDDIASRIAELAAEPYDYDANWASASRVADTLLPTDGAAVLAVMVRPPPMPAGEDPLRWLPRLQIAAARVLAQLDTGWRHSVRRETLFSALWGAADWTTIAAIIALAQLAQSLESAATDIRDAFATLAAHQPQGAPCCYEYALCCNWLLLPNVSETERRQLETRVEQIETRWPPEDRPPGRDYTAPRPTADRRRR